MMNDRQFLDAFESCTLPKGTFHHGDHVRIAWIMLKEGPPLEEVLSRFTRAIKRFAGHHGVPGLYHQTITWIYLFMINERMTRLGREHDWSSFCSENPDLFGDHRRFLGRYYSDEILDSELARHNFILPDRIH